MTTTVQNTPNPVVPNVLTEATPTQGANTTANPTATTTAQPTSSVPNTTNGAQFTLEYMRVTYSANGQGGRHCHNHQPWSPTGCMPPPNSTGLSGAPAGQGLTKNSDGSVTTAGGYKIVPEGKDAAWSVYDKDGKQLTRVWGDPHVAEGDGTKWDFTKGSNFVLPDGTRIGVSTTAETGHSVTKGLDIANGQDRIQVSGIDQNAPVTGEPTRDGLAGWQQANGVGRDTFALQHDANNQDWVKYDANGAMHGVITGAKDEGGSYQQITNGQASQLQQTPVAGQQQGFGLDQLAQLFGLGGPQNLFGNNPMGGLFGGQDPFGFGQNGLGQQNGMGQQDPMQFLGLLSQLFGLGGFGGLGNNGMSPLGGYQAVQQLQGLLYQAFMEQAQQAAQLQYGRYNQTWTGR